MRLRVVLEVEWDKCPQEDGKVVAARAFDLIFQDLAEDTTAWFDPDTDELFSVEEVVS